MSRKLVILESKVVVWAKVENRRFKCFNNRDDRSPLIDIEIKPRCFNFHNTTLYIEADKKYEFKINQRDISSWQQALEGASLPIIVWVHNVHIHII